jgi:hypothetical protein
MSTNKVKGTSSDVSFSVDCEAPTVVVLCCIGMGNTLRRSPQYDHGFTPLQLQVKKDQIKACKERGDTPTECKHCHNKTMYMYHSFSKRGGTKYLYCCGACFYHCSDLIVSEEDYDFLSG